MNVLTQIQNSPTKVISTIAPTKPVLCGLHASKKSYLEASIDLEYHYAMALGVAEANYNQTLLNMIASITDRFRGEAWDEVRNDEVVAAFIERVKTENNKSTGLFKIEGTR